MKKTILIILFFTISYNSFSQLYLGFAIHQANSISSYSYGSWDWGLDFEYQLKEKSLSVGIWPLVRNIDNRKEPISLYQIPFMYRTSKTVFIGGLPSHGMNFGAGLYLDIPFLGSGLDQAVFYGISNEMSFSFYFPDNSEGRIGLLTNFDLGLGRAECGVFMRFLFPAKGFWNKLKTYKF